MESKEKGMFYNWSCFYGKSYNYLESRGQESCFVEHRGEKYIEEYGFETIVEIKTYLACLWSKEKIMKEIIKPVAVAAMKNQPKVFGNEKKAQSLDEFIYIF